jgi:hypothetical protein
MDNNNKKIPTHLKHKPVVVIENYETIDGKNSEETDAKGLSLGLAQWNERGNVDISAKVWRYTGEKWSRQSEELPMHRVIDLAILICRTKQYFNENDNLKDNFIDSFQLKTTEEEKKDKLKKMDISICIENERINDDIELFKKALSNEDKIIDERLTILSSILKQMGY